MKVRDYAYKLKLARRIILATIILMTIGAFWLIDSIDITISDEFTNWYTNAFFLLKIAVLSIYFSLAYVIMHLITMVIKYVVHKALRV